MQTVSLIEASRRAALQEMRRDERVWVLGEDVARGGLWGQYRDFLGEFGEQRVVSTPISESTIMGAGLGSALVGMRPIIEMRIFDFVMCAMDELVNQIAKDTPVRVRLAKNGSITRSGDANAAIATVARAAIELLAGNFAYAIKECDADECTRLYVDNSRRGSRRWCDMSGCGNRAKVAAFRARHS